MLLMLSGYKGSGKDTVASYLVQKYGFVRVSFADALKDHVALQYNVPRELLDSPAGKETPLYSLPVVSTDSFSKEIHRLLTSELQSGYWTPRALLILEGSIKRSVAPQYWITKVMDALRLNEKVVISDWRYKSELQLLSSVGFMPVAVRVSRFNSIDTLEASERDLDYYPFDYILRNESDIQSLHAQVDAILRPALSVEEYPENQTNLWEGYIE